MPLVHEAGRALLRQQHRLLEFDDPAQIPDHLEAADALYCYWPMHVDARTLARSPRLKVIAAAGSGVDHIDLAAAQAAGIVVTHTVGHGARSIAEHAIGHILCLAKRLVEVDRAVRAGEFQQWRENKGAHRYAEISGKTLAIVGYGAIGRELARIAARGFDMKVIAVTRPGRQLEDPNVDRQLPLREALAAADIVSIHAPLSAATRGLIGRAELACMKPGAWLIDTSRGGVVDSAALVDAVRSGQIGGAGLDVFDPEPPGVHHPVLELPNVVLSPHSAGITGDAYRRLALAAAKDIADALRGVRPAGLLATSAWAGSRAAAAGGQVA